MKKTTIALVAIISVTTITYVSCSKESSPPPQGNEFNINTVADSGSVYNLTGKQYFRAIFFGDGAFANESPVTQHLYTAYQNLTATDEAKADILLNYITSSLESANPTFFTDFATSITSEEREEIFDGLATAGVIAYSYNLDGALAYFDTYTPAQLQIYIDNASQDPENTEIANSFSTPGVISTIFDALLYDVSLQQQSTQIAFTEPVEDNLYYLADDLLAMDLSTTP